jgi:hypothetical protein
MRGPVGIFEGEWAAPKVQYMAPAGELSSIRQHLAFLADVYSEAMPQREHAHRWADVLMELRRECQMVFLEVS